MTVDVTADLLASIELPSTRRSVAVARRVVAHLLTGWAAEPLRDDTVLLLSELITNVVRHVVGPTVLRIDLRLSDPSLRVAVLDPSPTLPTLGDQGPSGGHGLHLVAALADQWGSEPHDDGKRVWFELRRRR
jgi:anti-sigma regulatory factor (Ser/Thr protein kinase)